MNFTAKDVQALRERTGCGMMDCKKTLVEADGDMEKAIELLREKGLAAAAKKAGRIAAEGIVVSIVDDAKKVGVVLEVNSETDFVAKNKDFIAFVNAVAKTIINNNPANVEELSAMQIADGNTTVAESLTEKILTIGENMKIRRFERLEGDLIAYVHGEGRIGVLVKFDTDVASKDGFKDFGKDVAMQVAAAIPQFLNKDDVPQSTIQKEKDILLAQIANDEKNKNKPQNVVEKMVEGKINKFFKEVCLLDQAFVKNGDISVKAYANQTAETFGGKIAITSFVRFEKGEGLEKREDNFADEVAGMIK
jgi:elongation factor Ts